MSFSHGCFTVGVSPNSRIQIAGKSSEHMANIRPHQITPAAKQRFSWFATFEVLNEWPGHRQKPDVFIFLCIFGMYLALVFDFVIYIVGN